MSTATTTATSATSTSAAAAATKSDLNLSLEPHLVERLQPLLPVLPPDISDELASVLFSSDAALSSESKTTTLRVISYSLLSSVSAWTRSPSGRSSLQGLSPPLHPNSYTIVSLLAGARTSPERKFPKYSKTATTDLEREAERSRSDRRAITALLNALLSIVGSGVATWWAADRLHWKEEWRVLLALLVAVVVAIAEGVLYLIWDSRRSEAKSLSRSFHKVATTRRIRNPDDATSTDLVPPPADTADPMVGSSYQDYEQKAAVMDSHSGPTAILPTAYPDVQAHTTIDGLRERSKRQH